MVFLISESSSPFTLRPRTQRRATAGREENSYFEGLSREKRGLGRGLILWVGIGVCICTIRSKICMAAVGNVASMSVSTRADITRLTRLWRGPTAPEVDLMYLIMTSSNS